MKDVTHALITGGSSGIGRALALALAQPGRRLALCGRNAERLEAVAAACRARGATVTMRVLDVADRDAMAAWIEDAVATAPLDLVIANAGASTDTLRAGDPAGAETEDAAALESRLFAVNVGGILNTLGPVVPHMVARRRGRIAVLSSLAAFRGLPSAPAYCATKAAVKVYAEGLRPRLLKDGVSLTVVCPGFVESRITAKNPFPMPFLIDAPKAATIILRALKRRRAVVAFPWPTATLARLHGLLPRAWTDPWLARLPAKE